MSKLRIRSRAWDATVIVTVIALFIGGWGGLIVVREAFPGDASATLVVLIVLGILTFAFFAGPGIVYVARKRVPSLQRRLPGDAMAWVRAHLYLPVLALAAAYVHATVAPFRDVLSSGKLTLAVGLLVAAAGVVRHRLIAVQAEALNVDVEIDTLLAERSRELRTLVHRYRAGEADLDATDAAVARLDEPDQATWREVRSLSLRVERSFPRGGGQAPLMRQQKVWRAVHAPLTIVLFVLLGYHVADTLGGGRVFGGDAKDDFVSSADCGDCHSQIYDEWSRSALAHAQTSQLMLAQLPVTLNENAALAAALGAGQEGVLKAKGKICLSCHAQIGARFAAPDALLPLEEVGAGGHPAVEGGGDAVQADGVGCVVCHTQAHAPPENGGNDELAIGTASALSYGTQYGPLFDDPSPLPTRAHDASGAVGLFGDPIASSQLCGACHNVTIDLDGDGAEPLTDAQDDLVLQTTYDEWQFYLQYFDASGPAVDGVVDAPVGCTECHMPSVGKRGVVEYAPGVFDVPDRASRSHSFVGVDYDLAPDAYSSETLSRLLAERKALLRSAVTLEVRDPGTVGGDEYTADVVVRNNGLGHRFPTGFAFARQFWLEVSARTGSGQRVPLVAPAGFPSVPAVSGRVDGPAGDLPQCETSNPDVRFAAAFAPGECDPWLVNFQKILTDGTPDDQGRVDEVPYQAFLPAIVRDRNRAVDNQRIASLDPAWVDPNTGEVKPPGETAFGYTFDTRGLPAGEPIVVTARLRFRHVPPDFVRALAKRVKALRDVPESARIDARALLRQLVITDVMRARSGEGLVQSCAGPQNVGGGSIFDCLGPDGA